jgi:quinol monooxygenase YgiN
MKNQSEQRSMSAYGCYVKFTAQLGQRDALIEHLLSAAALMEKAAACQLYLINTSLAEPESVWVTEVWSSQEEHDASLTIEGVQASIKQVLPLLARSPEKIDVLPVGGKGFPLKERASPH